MNFENKTDWRYELTDLSIVCITAGLLIFFGDNLTLSALIFALSAAFIIYLASVRKNLELKVQYHWLVLAALLGVIIYYIREVSIFFLLFYVAMRFSFSLIRFDETQEIFDETEKLRKDYEALLDKTKLEVQRATEDELLKLKDDLVCQRDSYEQKIDEIRQNLSNLQQEKIHAIESECSRRKVELEKFLSNNEQILAEKKFNIETEKAATISAVTSETQRQIEILTERLHQKDEYIFRLESENERSQNKIFSNKELHKLLVRTLENAKKEVDIMSPWVTWKICNKKLRKKILRLLEKGVVIKIAYGIENSHVSNNSESDRNKTTEDLIEKLKVEFSEFSNFHTNKISSHGKMFICDSDYYILTSMNPLSNDGSLWEEIGEQSRNLKNLEEYRKKYFDF